MILHRELGLSDELSENGMEKIDQIAYLYARKNNPYEDYYQAKGKCGP